MKFCYNLRLLCLFVVCLLPVIQVRADDTIYTKVDENPTPVRTPPPEYPIELRRNGVSGIVAVVIVIGQDGKVVDASVANTTDPGFNDAALKAVRLWRFKPAKIGGEPVKVRVTLPMRFNVAE
jgi:protein TonB